MISEIAVAVEPASPEFWQLALVCALPGFILLAFYLLDIFGGWKTSLGSGFAGIVAGVEMIDLSFIQPEIATALASGSALAAVAANSRWISER
jgi:hypothetical protein